MGGHAGVKSQEAPRRRHILGRHPQEPKWEDFEKGFEGIGEAAGWEGTG